MISVADVEAIGGYPHATLRNLRITQAYHELSTALAAATGAGANWCTLATWASKQAGQTIRGDDLGRKIEQALADSEAVAFAVSRLRDARRALGRAVDANAVLAAIRDVCTPLLTITRVAAAVAQGNKKVFDEIGREVARFLALPERNAQTVGTFCAGLAPGDPPDGQRLLADAFRDYVRAPSLVDDQARAERLFLANIRIGLHEQTRLQPEILDALNAPLPDPATVVRQLAEKLFPTSRGRPRSRLVARVLDEVAGRLLAHLRAIVREVVTAELMTITLPGGTLHLGRDLTGPFPEHLALLTDPDLVEFMREVDPTRDSPSESGARDWANFRDRMHYIADFFRMLHANADLFRPPFTAEQLVSIAAGRTPDGIL
jgi:hypothetical protein